MALLEGYRRLTAKEHAHTRKLLWRTTMVRLAERVGVKAATISGAVNEENPRPIRIEVIEKVMALQLDDFKALRIRKHTSGL